MPENFDKQFQNIEATLAGLLDTKDLINAERDRLVDLGVFDGIPIESWEQRGSVANQYLTLVFKSLPNGTHSGPNGKRKLYIGGDTSKIRNAQAKVRSTVQYRALCDRIDILNRQIYRIAEAVDIAERICKHMNWKSLGMSANPLHSPLANKKRK
jgi:hypothetical protein